METEDLLFYDIECFPMDSLVVMKTIDGEVVCKCWNNPERKDAAYDSKGFDQVEEVIAGKTLVGYNNHFYDDTMLARMLNSSNSQDTLKQLSDLMINGSRDIVKIENRTLDCMQQIDVSHPSLKQIEGNIGMSIEETVIAFNTPRHLTEEEKLLTEKYCEHDIDATIEVFKLREHSYFDVKLQVVEMLPPELREKAIRWNTTSIVGKLLAPKQSKPWEHLGGSGQSLDVWNAAWNRIDEIPNNVWELWDSADREDYPKNKSIKTTIFDCEFTFGFGGLHGVNKSRKKFGKVNLLDVASMYPSILINLRALGDKTDTYSDIKTERIKIKHIDKLKSNALKLILNSTYGLLKSEYSNLCNPKASSTVCIYGQMVIFDLCRMLHEAGYTLVNINTDGVAFEDNGSLEYERIQEEWQHKYNLTLELDEFDFWLQKDVNNYIATHDGKVKTKGGEVGKYREEKPFSNNNARICNIVLVEKLLNPELSVIDELKRYRNDAELYDPKLWMYVLKAGGTYAGVFDTMSGMQQQKVNRVFAAKNGKANISLVKRRIDGGDVKFPDCPERMFLWNDDVSRISQEDFKEFIDIDHYKKIIDKKLKEWT